MEKLTTSEQWKEKFTMREMELSNQIQTLQAAATAVEEEKAKQASTIDQELKMVQKQLHQTRVDALASEEQKLKAEAENEALKRRVAASDDLASVCTVECRLWIDIGFKTTASDSCRT